MSAFSVDPESLEAAATAARKMADAATPTTGVEHPSDVGHDGLADAIRHFATEVDQAWKARVDDLHAIPTTLADSASTYENADAEAAAVLRRADGHI